MRGPWALKTTAPSRHVFPTDRHLAGSGGNELDVMGSDVAVAPLVVAAVSSRTVVLAVPNAENEVVDADLRTRILFDLGDERKVVGDALVPAAVGARDASDVVEPLRAFALVSGTAAVVVVAAVEAVFSLT